ncbi:Tctex1 domain-containing protein 1 [Amphibalanus amphitrite]|uniref:Tctex1 domain-containing protein 1 n=1 Tax=Amphibalanus amphitrite TaxID=1232801 RepID=A0A6A4WNW1_AMPAM|nr:dynein light chain Tctex-type protein 2B-like [Amphibalanus amphitrite]XP_043210392.1 dynein light chain Tctex-type protein 2B-like [Amphibalanus amphitrite]KAF0309086.1 Tctex1 domain-containing protein 1 [Amphibalanus amphitrite]
MGREKDLSTVVEITHKDVPRELDDFQLQKRQRHEHSYDMQMDQPTVPEPIERVAKRVLDRLFGGQSYDADEARRLAVAAAEKIKDETLGLVSPRVRLVVQVVVTESRGQAVRAISRCVWDAEKDRCMRAEFANQQLRAVASVFAIYCE